MDDTVSAPVSIPHALAAAAADAGDRPAVIEGDQVLTHEGLWATAREVAAALVAQGVRPGDRVGLWAPNSLRWVVAAYGILCAGAVLTPLNTRFRGAEAAYALNLVRVEVLLVQRHFLDTDYVAMLRSAEDLPHLRTVVSFEEASTPDSLGWQEFLAAGAGHNAEVEQRIEALGPDDVADILFTSGTTGHPKGAMVSHGSNLVTDLAWATGAGVGPEDRYLLVNPLFHSFGYRAGMLACLLVRAALHPVGVFDVGTVLELIHRHRITVLPGAPTVFRSLLDDPRHRSADLSSLRLAVTGAAMVPVPLLRAMRDELGIGTVLTAYGQTESCGTATICPPDADEHRLSTTSGVAIPGVEVEIHDAAGNRLPAGESGEIVIRGPNVMIGYFENPRATEETIDRQGWLHTGDVGWLDADGYLTITDRLKDMFISGGFNVYPAEVERVLLEHPRVADVAVVGQPDPRFGEVARAVVVPAAGGDPSEAELIAFCRERLANYKCPRAVEFVDTLPRNAGGKIQKFKLRDTSPDRTRGI
ncbi:fatty acid--CoA ligase [Enemella dayhoffiae]|uniref:Fatty acid--CoA ligase n=1 Tax=Enemella dayhoffiae TaxID=2016507 RepID=A0A255GL61_9ACTN|nr:AMP-binding protein [Enemella dayhoffiae]OYO16578.1 fatty acid--CoA ligase [Enemella dayhoffiae]